MIMRMPQHPEDQLGGWALVALVVAIACAIVLLAGCGRRQAAIGAANIDQAAAAILSGADPAPAATGIRAQAQAIHRALDPAAQATVPEQAWHASPDAAIAGSAAQAKAIDDEGALWAMGRDLLSGAWGWLVGAVPALGVAGAIGARLVAKWKGIAGSGIALAQRAKHAAEDAIAVAKHSDDSAVAETAAAAERNLAEALASAKAWQERAGVRAVVDHMRRAISS
jgi:hypothetical protein